MDIMQQLTKKERYTLVLDWFRKNVPDAKTELDYDNPFHLLISVILSAQCTDKRVNIVTPELFKTYPTPKSLAEAEDFEVFEYIKSISYPHNKAKHLVGMAKMLVDEFNSQVPSEENDLLKLPGVGRKTANVILSVVYNKPAMAVDTHVFRVSERIGLTTNAKTPFDAEKQLIKYIPTEDVATAHHWLILHGRYTCLARKPKCEICELTEYCKYYQKNKLS